MRSLHFILNNVLIIVLKYFSDNQTEQTTEGQKTEEQTADGGNA